MKNVIVFRLGEHRYCLELRWIREVFTLGHVTSIPSAPVCIPGLVNFRGAITPVLDLAMLTSLDGAPSRPAVEGDTAILIECEAVRAALRVDAVERVATLDSGEDPNQLVDLDGRSLPLLHPPELIDRATENTKSAAFAP